MGYERQVGTNWDNQIANFSAVALRFFVEKCVQRRVIRRLL
jgi:hypothetical protein